MKTGKSEPEPAESVVDAIDGPLEGANRSCPSSVLRIIYNVEYFNTIKEPYVNSRESNNGALITTADAVKD